MCIRDRSYIHAEGYPAAEMKHGPIALIDAEMPVVVVATHNAMYEKIMSNIHGRPQGAADHPDGRRHHRHLCKQFPKAVSYTHLSFSLSYYFGFSGLTA